MRSMTSVSRMAATIFSSPPQFGQCSMSISNTRLSSRAATSANCSAKRLVTGPVATPAVGRVRSTIPAVRRPVDASPLRDHGCLFGGGTAIVLRHGEYRESVDVGFLVSDLGGYRRLRERLTGTAGIGAIGAAGSNGACR